MLASLLHFCRLSITPSAAQISEGKEGGQSHLRVTEPTGATGRSWRVPTRHRAVLLVVWNDRPPL